MLSKKHLFVAMIMLVTGLIGIQAEADPVDEIQATITGTVVDASSGEALEGVEVTLAENDQSATSDSEGNFAFEELEAGTYTLSASADGYEDWEESVEITEEGGSISIELQPSEE